MKCVAEGNQDILPARIAINLVNCRVGEQMRVAPPKLLNVDLGQSFSVLIHSVPSSSGARKQGIRLAAQTASGARRSWMAAGLRMEAR
ncbi:hypothetical protein AUC61_01005 [Pseudomonas sp. S25]|uniref:Uncharacterized protein n=1 Tax=Pseudomonas maioricensis TaxID=1766623 RepID=A0ABS9ZC87_9PSED|nr:hypothetical protein [Pseudomonas sp. S25]